MTLHVFGAIVTANGTAANNRGITEGNVSTLQKLVWNGQVHTTISAESIRFALRRRLEENDLQDCNRTYNEITRTNEWKDPDFARWAANSKDVPFADDDLLGYMQAKAGAAEGEDKAVKVRRAVLEITRAVSLTPWPGDVTFNAASPGATPSAQKKGSNPVPYGTEMHATRYQYGFALTPKRLREARRADIALDGLCALGEVAGNHGRFLFDFSPESIVFRLTDDPAPRILYAFSANDDGKIGVADLIRKVRSGDVPASELIIGGAISEELKQLAKDDAALAGWSIHMGIRAACVAAIAELRKRRG